MTPSASRSRCRTAGSIRAGVESGIGQKAARRSNDHLRRGRRLFRRPLSSCDSQPAIRSARPSTTLPTALADHPRSTSTTPVAATLGGYSGTYVDVQVPSDIDSSARTGIPPVGTGHLRRRGPISDGICGSSTSTVCASWSRPWTTRRTSEQHQAELQAIVELDPDRTVIRSPSHLVRPPAVRIPSRRPGTVPLPYLTTSAMPSLGGRVDAEASYRWQQAPDRFARVPDGRGGQAEPQAIVNSIQIEP